MRASVSPEGLRSASTYDKEIAHAFRPSYESIAMPNRTATRKMNSIKRRPRKFLSAKNKKEIEGGANIENTQAFSYRAKWQRDLARDNAMNQLHGIQRERDKNRKLEMDRLLALTPAMRSDVVNLRIDLLKRQSGL